MSNAMEATISCGGCQRQYRMKPELAGKRARCKCGAEIEFPAKVGPLELIEADGSPPVSARPSRPVGAAVARDPSKRDARGVPERRELVAGPVAVVEGVHVQVNCLVCGQADVDGEIVRHQDRVVIGFMGIGPSVGIGSRPYVHCSNCGAEMLLKTSAEELIAAPTPNARAAMLAPPLSLAWKMLAVVSVFMMFSGIGAFVGAVVYFNTRQYGGWPYHMSLIAMAVGSVFFFILTYASLA